MELRLFYAGISLTGFFLMGALEVCTMLPESLNVREVDTGRDDRILIRIRVSSEARGKISSARVDFRAELTVIIQQSS